MTLSLLLCARPVCAQLTFTEPFNGYAAPTSVTNAGWNLISDTANPVYSPADFATDNGTNVIKITASNDPDGHFTSAYVYIEHDIDQFANFGPYHETTLSGNLNGQDAGDVLLTTAKPATANYATTVDINGATFSVDYAFGTAFGSGGVGRFAIVLSTGGRYAMDSSFLSSFPWTNIVHKTSDPVDAPTTEWRTVLAGGGAGGQRLRLADTPQFLSSNQLASVAAVGVYIYPAGDTIPSRLDNFRLANFHAAADLSPFVINSVSTQGNDIEISWLARGGRSYEVQALTAAGYATNLTTLAGPINIPGGSSTTTNYIDGGGATNSPARFYRVKLLP